MSKKIVIVGALGYLGSELCELYSGESWHHNIIAIDNRFVSKRVNQLKNWNIRFYQGQILDKEFLKKHLHDADIVHHLAGITDVAYVKKESNPNQDENIKKTRGDKIQSIRESIFKFQPEISDQILREKSLKIYGYLINVNLINSVKIIDLRIPNNVVLTHE